MKYWIVVPMEHLGGQKQADYTRAFQPSKNPTLNFTSEAMAQAHAEHMALNHLGKDIVIFEAKRTLVATDPKFVKKEWSDNGELIPAKAKQA